MKLLRHRILLPPVESFSTSSTLTYFQCQRRPVTGEDDCCFGLRGLHIPRTPPSDIIIVDFVVQPDQSINSETTSMHCPAVRSTFIRGFQPVITEGRGNASY